jgi:hypothetical protein
MTAQEIWCLLAVVAGVASAVLAAAGPTIPGSWPARATHALLAAAVACVAVALWIAL